MLTAMQHALQVIELRIALRKKHLRFLNCWHRCERPIGPKN